MTGQLDMYGNMAARDLGFAEEGGGRRFCDSFPYKNSSCKNTCMEVKKCINFQPVWYMFTLTHVPQNKQWIEMNYSRPLSEKSENIKKNIKYKYIIFLRLAFIGKVKAHEISKIVSKIWSLQSFCFSLNSVFTEVFLEIFWRNSDANWKSTDK